jgi:hypothetical protein
MLTLSHLPAVVLGSIWLAGTCSGTLLEKPVFKGPIDLDLAVVFGDERVIGYPCNGSFSILSWDINGFPDSQPRILNPTDRDHPFTDRWGRVFTLTDYSRNLNLMRLDPYEVAATFEIPFGMRKESLRNMTSETHLPRR